ncbi:MAG: alkylated DNA repair dioxygenase AlkB [Paraglaciecola sp.]|jgi:alkylated DNA repair dioxygenase AlkB
MAQQSLFDDEPDDTPVVLRMQDADVSFYPHFLAPQQADFYLTGLMDSLAWQQDEITLYGNKLALPRLQAWYGEPEAVYAYSGLSLRPKMWTPQLMALKTLCETACGQQFNSVLANLYRDGQDSMGSHADNEPELGERPCIASLSLGQSRVFDFRHRLSGQKLRLSLEHGSLLIMRGSTQDHWQHAIPKSKKPMDPRINLTFRRIIG